MTTATPLAWPEGWPRTPDYQKKTGDGFKKKRYVPPSQPGGSGYDRFANITFPESRDLLFAALKKLKAASVVVSTDHPTDRFNLPVESKRKVNDNGVAVYFQYLGRAQVMACDRYMTTAANMRSLGLAIEALCQLERHGGGVMMEKAFEGFAALTDGTGGKKSRHWSEILGVDPRPLGVSPAVAKAMIEAAWKEAIAAAHPDKEGGSDEAAQEVNTAREQALAEIGA